VSEHARGNTGRPGWITLARDITSYVGGWLLIFRQAGILFDPPAQPNDTVIWIGALLIGVPGVAQILAWRFGGGSTTAPVGSSPAAPGSSSQQSPSPNGGDGDR